MQMMISHPHRSLIKSESRLSKTWMVSGSMTALMIGCLTLLPVGAPIALAQESSGTMIKVQPGEGSIIDSSQLTTAPSQGLVDQHGKPIPKDPLTGQNAIWPAEGVEPFEFTNQDGEKINNESLKGKPYAISFVFTQCRGPCPMVTGAMRELADRTQKYDVNLVTLSIDPTRDTPQVLKEYAKTYGADTSRWQFLTGPQNEVHKLIATNFLMPVGEDTSPQRELGKEFEHTTNVMLVDAQGVVRGKFNSTNPAEMAILRRHLITLATGVEPEPLPEEKMIVLAGNVRPIPPEDLLPRWVKTLPAINAALNGLATLLLITGYICIRRGQREMHRQMMLSTFMTSVVFLACYLVYHWALHAYTGSSGKKFEGTGIIRPVYFAILVTHVALAALVPVLAIITISRALRGQWERHRQLAVITFPIWLYVSVTGVLIYFMLYHLFPSPQA